LIIDNFKFYNCRAKRDLFPGYTLVELLVVLGIIVLVISLVPLSFNYFSTSGNIKKFFFQISSAIRLGKEEAVIRGKRIYLVFNEEENIFQLLLYEKSLDVEEGEDEEEEEEQEGEEDFELLEICKWELPEDIEIEIEKTSVGGFKDDEIYEVLDKDKMITFSPRGWVDKATIYIKSPLKKRELILEVNPLTGRVKIVEGEGR
jgi:hypothetical protein